ncbi:MAG TPA: response regulator transcription factor [Blastocatellia bacterium]|nr:response regulator transcription factor [Blastocatellia bacterium]
MAEIQPIRVLIIDDQPVVRIGIRMIVQGNNTGMVVVGEAANRDEGLELASTVQPDVILLDLNLGDDNGLDLIPELLAIAPRSKVLILTGLHALELHRRAIRAGAMGVVLKEKEPEILLSAISTAHAGGVWIHRSLMTSLIKEETGG